MCFAQNGWLFNCYSMLCVSEREELNEMINKLHAQISQLREKEASVSQKLKRSLDAVDQAQFEKNQVRQQLLPPNS